MLAGLCNAARMGRAALPAITAIAYLLIAATPCPPSAQLRAAASHESHEHGAASGDSASLTAPCVCGCEHGTAGLGVAKRAEPAVLRAPMPPPLQPTRSFARER